MQFVLFNEHRLGVMQDSRVVDARAALEGLQFRRPQDLIEDVITHWEALKPKIAAAPMGPALGTADEIADPQDLQVRLVYSAVS